MSRGIRRGVNAVGDFIGFDGQFGYQGRADRTLGVSGVGRALGFGTAASGGSMSAGDYGITIETLHSANDGSVAAVSEVVVTAPRGRAARDAYVDNLVASGVTIGLNYHFNDQSQRMDPIHYYGQLLDMPVEYVAPRAGNIDYRELSGYADAGPLPNSRRPSDIYIGYTPIAGAYHAVVIAQDPDSGYMYSTRGGPAWGEGSLKMKLQAQSWAESPDRQNLVGIQYVGRVDMPISRVASTMVEYSNMTIRNNLDYLILAQNSNSYAFSYIKSIGFPRPKPIMLAPGAGANQPDPRLSYYNEKRN